MALGKQVTGDNGAVLGTYHRIRTLVTDYDAGQQHVYVAHYADKSYRAAEKDEIAENQAKIDRYNELTAKMEKTDEEEMELRGIVIQDLMAFEHASRTCGPDTKITLPIETDARETVYEQLGGTVEQYGNAKNV